MWDEIVDVLNDIDSVMYYPILMILMIIAGLYFTALTKGVQVRLFGESCRILMEPSADKKKVSSFQTLLVSTASRVGTGNIIGVSTESVWEDPEPASGCGSCVSSELPLLL